MKIKIHQINSWRDKNRVQFQPFEKLPILQKSAAVDKTLYDVVFEGYVDARTLDDIFIMFNVLERPTEYKRYSLSISDIIEVIESENIKTGYYYVDVFGFKKVKF